MAFTIDPTTVIGRIRLRISDRDPLNPVFDDDSLNVFYTDEGSNVLRASAAALEAIAINEILVLKVVKNLSLSTDGAKVGDAILKTAQRYRDLAEEQENQLGGSWDIGEMVVDEFTRRERLAKENQRANT